MRSESWKFIWQPKVSIRYFFAISVAALRAAGTFAFRFPAFVRLRPAGFGATGAQKFSCAGPHLVADVGAAHHPCNLVYPALLVKPDDRGGGALAADGLLD